ncbi:hypothetical protein [Cohnella rhizosphaerae]|uniref:Uncharacterized protein n=1 Tax=Cohnella rhizosphaerae TaxID=1457232 RepID=A0A9X4KVB3_9BACL|nr:hypothetical protein [Cohnella rhizosphaerae]MDG0811804.1 hypothetical protein [Cohnella rhizosphaerae]
MKTKAIIGVIALTLAVGAANIVQSVYADVQKTTPGGSEDPIVTKSYVDQKIDAITNGQSGGEGAGVSSKLQVVTVPLGSTLLVEEGGELIVRTGKAIAVSSDSNGLSDMTDGLDIAPGKPVGKNHLILFPRAGRGVMADPMQKNGLTVLVRGAYQLK